MMPFCENLAEEVENAERWEAAQKRGEGGGMSKRQAKREVAAFLAAICSSTEVLNSWPNATEEDHSRLEHALNEFENEMNRRSAEPLTRIYSDTPRTYDQAQSGTRDGRRSMRAELEAGL